MFGTAVVCYLFLGGTGAGGCFVLALLGLLVPREELVKVQVDGMFGDRRTCFAPSRTYRALFMPAYACSAFLLVLGVVLLVVDLGRADRLLLLVTSPQATYLVAGAYALFACVLFAVVLAVVWSGCVYRMRVGALVALELAMCAIALVVMAYTGLLLQSLSAVPLWNTAWTVVLFVLSSASCGFAAVLAQAQFFGAGREFSFVLRRVMLVDAGVIAAEALVMALLLTTVAVGAQEISATAVAAKSSLDWLMRGAGAPVFWGAFVALGLVVPLAMEFAAWRLRRISANAACGLAACVLVGGCAMRWCLVEAGMHPVLVAVGAG